MIELKIWGLILSFAIPMILSPGPGNTILAAAGGKFGVRGTLPFWLGFESGNFLWCLVYGFGLSQIVKAHPFAYEVLKWGGTLYILYLAWCFFRSSAMAEQQELKPLSFFDGFASLSLNPKVHSMILVMFSQFLNPALPLVAQVTQMALVFVLVGFVCHFVWIYCGQVLFSRIKSQAAMRAQGIAFGICMILVAAFVAFS
ncbi:LysE family translocator [Pseudolysobacter antarcticus]|uniref:LysE family translocator n=1 Tax=Pseudolysobacter antarcticus TaxID=2511995 RepID=A0A411HGR0_9GAMM|nr:LysE family translocator [Pseudolysobacter antarcticus]QBB69679.1 LysE family translocator [Pseudolysobacter antarcticus]